MIRRRRTSAAIPKDFAAKSRRAFDDLRKFSGATKRIRGQLRFSFDPSIWDDETLRKALLQLFERKCAYCESPLTESTLVVDRFRPFRVRTTRRDVLAPTGGPFTALRRQLIEERLGTAPAQPVSAVASPPTRTHVWLQRVEIHNFRSLRRLELAFPESSSDRAP